LFGSPLFIRGNGTSTNTHLRIVRIPAGSKPLIQQKFSESWRTSSQSVFVGFNLIFLELMTSHHDVSTTPPYATKHKFRGSWKLCLFSASIYP
jgi:hypothetical protein